MNSPHVVFIGGGQMAGAYIGGMLRHGWSRAAIAVVEPDAAQRARLHQRHGVTAMAESAPAELARADAVIWAVKPQVLRDAARALAPCFGPVLHVSIAAGVRADDLSRWLGTARVVRAMPNTPALVSSGVTGLFAGEAVGAPDRALVERLLASTGRLFWVDSDERIDAITAISGSGPAYVFHFLEGLQAGAQTLGFEPGLARELALRVAQGAVAQALQDDEPLSVLRARVTSRGGTTQAALEVFDRARTQATTVSAVQAAYRRAVEMAKDAAR